MISEEIVTLLNTVQMAVLFVDQSNNIKKHSELLDTYFKSNSELKGFLYGISTETLDKFSNIEIKVEEQWYQIRHGMISVDRYILFIEDISLRKIEIERLNDALVKLSPLVARDTMTGLYHKEYFTRKLISLISKNDCSTSSVLFFDIDFFKKYNDHYGHVRGDDCLKKVSRLIEQNTRSLDIVARFGGEEFIVLLNGSNQTTANDITNRILNEIAEEKIEHEMSPFGVITLSAGAFSFNNNEFNLYQDILNNADQLLYISKNNGRNQFTPRYGNI